MICMSLDMIRISKRAINFNGITSHHSGQPINFDPSISIEAMESLLTIADNLEPGVTLTYKYAASKKDEKAN